MDKGGGCPKGARKRGVRSSGQPYEEGGLSGRAKEDLNRYGPPHDWTLFLTRTDLLLSYRVKGDTGVRVGPGVS